MPESLEQIGRYQILSLLGEGAMAKVYKAVDTRIDRVVAIKLLQFREGMTDEMIQQLKDRFVHEAKFAGKLSHPNIVTIYDAEEENGASYMAMEYVDGQTLEHMIETDSTLSVEQKLDIMIQICHGLDYAHKHDIIHRDIKPGNIIFTTDDVAKIMDFGIAKITTSSTTVVGTILGTPGYMSPEQITGKAVDHRTDIFALGAVFYELLTNTKAFPGNNLTEIMYRVVSENPVPPSVVNNTLPEMLSDVVMKAMAKNPSERYETGGEFAKAIEEVKEAMASGTVKTVFTKSLLAGKKALPEWLSIFDNRRFAIGSFVWAVGATLALLVVLFSGDSSSRLAKSLTAARPASLTISMNVPDGEVYIDGELYRSNGSQFTLDSIGVGERHIRIKRDFYTTYETAVVFGKGEAKRIDARLKLLPVEIPAGADSSYITVRTVPPMVRVETSYGKFLGYTPIDSLVFPGGRYTLVFTKTDYVGRKRNIELRKNRATLVDQPLDKQRGLISLEKVFPETAVLFINNRRVFKNSRANIYQVDVGQYTATIKAEGYDDLTKSVHVYADSTVVFADTMAAQYGAVLIQSNPTGADVYLDESATPAGKTPLLMPKLLANVHQVRTEWKNEKRQQTVKISKNDTTTVKLVATYPNGYLQLTTDPPGAEVYVNTIRESDTKTPTVLELKPNTYKVRLVHPSFKKFHEVRMQIRPNQTTELSHKFEN